MSARQAFVPTRNTDENVSPAQTHQQRIPSPSKDQESRLSTSESHQGDNLSSNLPLNLTGLQKSTPLAAQSRKRSLDHIQRPLLHASHYQKQNAIKGLTNTPHKQIGQLIKNTANHQQQRASSPFGRAGMQMQQQQSSTSNSNAPRRSQLSFSTSNSMPPPSSIEISATFPIASPVPDTNAARLRNNASIVNLQTQAEEEELMMDEDMNRPDPNHSQMSSNRSRHDGDGDADRMLAAERSHKRSRLDSQHEFSDDFDVAPLDHTEVDGHSQYRYEHQTQYHRHSSELQDGQNSAYSHQNHHQTRQADQQQRSQLFQHTNTDQNNAGPTNHPMLDITFMDKKYIDQYEKARNRWVCATMEEWCGGAEDLTNTYGILLDFVKDHMVNKIKGYAAAAGASKQRRAVLSERKKTLATVRSGLEKEVNTSRVRF